jgi:hypothetical protein
MIPDGRGKGRTTGENKMLSAEGQGGGVPGAQLRRKSEWNDRAKNRLRKAYVAASSMALRKLQG